MSVSCFIQMKLFTNFKIGDIINSPNLQLKERGIIMGLVDSVQKAFDDAAETDISKIDFKRYDGFAGSIVQKFADTSIPVCPMCGNNPHWLLHQSQKVVSIFPIPKQDNYYFLRCESCGLTMHTLFHQVGDSHAPFLYNASPNDNTTIMRFDAGGNRAINNGPTGRQMTIMEINQWAASKRRFFQK